MPVIPATKETEMGKTAVEGSPGKMLARPDLNKIS
jgi:hypothetical protein